MQQFMFGRNEPSRKYTENIDYLAIFDQEEVVAVTKPERPFIDVATYYQRCIREENDGWA